jgi:hypothetical protein
METKWLLLSSWYWSHTIEHSISQKVCGLPLGLIWPATIGFADLLASVQCLWSDYQSFIHAIKALEPWLTTWLQAITSNELTLYSGFLWVVCSLLQTPCHNQPRRHGKQSLAYWQQQLEEMQNRSSTGSQGYCAQAQLAIVHNTLLEAGVTLLAYSRLFLFCCHSVVTHLGTWSWYCIVVDLSAFSLLDFYGARLAQAWKIIGLVG